jgi:hypothetical protein
MKSEISMRKHSINVCVEFGEKEYTGRWNLGPR